MTVSPKIREALEASRDAFTLIVGEAPAVEPVARAEMATAAYERWLWDSACWNAAETARPALEKINAALAEMEAQS